MKALLGRGTAMGTLAALLCTLLVLPGCGEHAGSVAIAGGCDPSSSPYLAPNDAVSGRITYCAGGDAAHGDLQTSNFPAGTPVVSLAFAGYPAIQGMSLEVVSTDGQRRERVVVEDPGESWKIAKITIPQKMRDGDFFIRLEDRATSVFGWAGMAAPLPPAIPYELTMALAVVALQSWLVLACCLWPSSWRAPEQTTGGLLLLGLISLLTFFCYVRSPPLGRAIAIAAWLIIPLLATVRLSKGARAMDRLRTHALAFLPCLVLALLVLWIGLPLQEWTGQDSQVPAHRWMKMPIDNWLPYILAAMVHEGRLDVPMFGDWLSSDRPPLQSGLFLLFKSIQANANGLQYQATSTWAQTLVLVPLAMLLRPLSSWQTRAVILLALAMSSLVLVNSLYVWPKLLAASFCALYHLMLFRESLFPGRSALRFSLAGVAAGLAMSTHGGALFALLGSTAVFAMRGRRNLLAGIPIGAAAILTYLPWLVYQRFIDPPGSRLLKWHLAGQIDIDDRTLGQTFLHAYGALTPGKWLTDHVSNLHWMAKFCTRFPSDVVAVLTQQAPVSLIIDRSFFHLCYAMWFASPLWLFLLAPLIVSRSRRHLGGFQQPDGLLQATGAGLLVWALLMFERDSTLIHHGAYFSFLALMLVVLANIATVSRNLLYAVAGLNISLSLWVYAFTRPPMPGEMFGLVAVGATLALALSLGWSEWRSARHLATPATPECG